MSIMIAQTPAFIEGGELLIRLVVLSLEIAIFVCILELLIRLRALFDTVLALSAQDVGTKVVKTLVVRKLHGAEFAASNVLTFDVEPGLGIQVVRTTTIKV